MLKDNFVYVGHILDRAEKIQQFIEGMSEQDFLNDEKTQSAVIREIEVIGEASTRISENFRKQYPSIPWKIMTAMRNLLIHNYEGVNPYRVWDTAKNDIPVLLSDIRKIIPKG